MGVKGGETNTALLLLLQRRLLPLVVLLRLEPSLSVQGVVLHLLHLHGAHIASLPSRLLRRLLIIEGLVLAHPLLRQARFGGYKTSELESRAFRLFRAPPISLLP